MAGKLTKEESIAYTNMALNRWKARLEDKELTEDQRYIANRWVSVCEKELERLSA